MRSVFYSIPIRRLSIQINCNSFDNLISDPAQLNDVIISLVNMLKISENWCVIP